MSDATDVAETLKVSCCIAGGGPAGMMLGFLLARAGIDVVVLEKHADFLRDFRGDTIHPSTLEIMYELGLLDEFRDMVKALHRAGIEVILDVVFNHTAEGGADGPTINFKGLGNELSISRG